jgi:hypothetical protein
MGKCAGFALFESRIVTYNISVAGFSAVHYYTDTEREGTKVVGVLHIFFCILCLMLITKNLRVLN